MKHVLRQLTRTLQQFMIGRYGNDELNRALSVAALIGLVLSLFLRIFYWIALALMIWSLCRTLSRNIPARLREREVYLRLRDNVRTKCRLYKRMWKERRTHRYFRCKHCKAVIRIPKGRGEVDVGCPRCHTHTRRKS